MARISFLVLLMLAGCVSQNLTTGKSLFDAGDFAAARDRFLACAKTNKDPRCMTYAGLTYAKLGDIKSTQYWFTEAARYGEPTAIANLNKAHWPVPAPDLATSK